MKYNSRMISFENVHRMNQRASPDKVLMYKHYLALYKLYNQNKPSLEWCSLHINQIFTSRQTNFKIWKSNNLKVGLNALANRFFILNDMIPLNWLEGGFDTFKIKCKALFLKTWNIKCEIDLTPNGVLISSFSYLIIIATSSLWYIINTSVCLIIGD